MTISVRAALALTAVWLPLIALAINALAERNPPASFNRSFVAATGLVPARSQAGTSHDHGSEQILRRQAGGSSFGARWWGIGEQKSISSRRPASAPE